MKTNKNNQMRNIVLTLMGLTFSLVATATEPSQPATVSDFQKGDTISIRRDSLRYMTGERISTWVYEVDHTVRQVDSKSHPNGILVGGIDSWITPGTAVKKGEATQQTTTASPVQQENVSGTESSKPSQGAGSTESANEQPATTTEPVNEQPATTTEPAQVTEPVKESANESAQPAKPKTTEPAETTPAAQGLSFNRFTVGVRGGYANSMAKTEESKRLAGDDVMLDLQYAHYWAKAEDKCRLGLLVGLGVGYMQSGLKQSWNEQFTANTSDGDILYTITADEVKDKTGQVQLEIPVMFSMITPGGFFLNAGPKLLLPVYTPSNQTITNPNVDAYFAEEGVHVVNEAVTGVVSAEQQTLKSTTDNKMKLNVMLGAELGYEFQLRSGNSIGLGVYANYGLWSMYKNAGDGSVLELTAPDGGKMAQIDIQSLTNAQASKMGYLDAGLKLTYNLNFMK